MGYSWMKELKRAAERLTNDVVAEATRRAMYRVQRDFHTKPLETIEAETGHPNLTQACYCMLNSRGADIDVEIYYDPSFIEGFFKSRSSFHQSGGKWRVVRKNKGLSSYDFWEMHYAGETGGDYGEVEEDWIMRNFWNGIEYGTNGWPLAKTQEFLSVYRTKTVSAYAVAQKFINDYIAAGYYESYIQEEINNLV